SSSPSTASGEMNGPTNAATPAPKPKTPVTTAVCLTFLMGHSIPLPHRSRRIPRKNGSTAQARLTPRGGWSACLLESWLRSQVVADRHVALRQPLPRLGLEDVGGGAVRDRLRAGDGQGEEAV